MVRLCPPSFLLRVFPLLFLHERGRHVFVTLDSPKLHRPSSLARARLHLPFEPAQPVLTTQWMWYPPMLLGVFLAPESPWWLVRKGRIEDAKKSFLRLTSSKDSSFNVDETIDMVRHTIALESEIHSGARYIDCFKGTNLRRTLLVCGIWATQNLSGNTFSNYSTYFFAQAGIAGTAAYDFAMGQYAINTVGVFGAWFLMSRGIGRRTLFTVGLCALCTALVAMGALGFAKGKIPDRTIGLATGSMMLVWAACYQLTVGTIAYSLVAEFPTRRLAVKTVAVSLLFY